MQAPYFHRIIRPDTSKRFEVVVHPRLDANNIVVNYPGRGGHIDGYRDKHRKMAEHMTKHIGAVVRMPNLEWPYEDYSETVVEDLRSTLNSILADSSDICGTASPTLLLLGYSAGASAIAAVAGDYPTVKRILLMAPSTNAPIEWIRQSLAEYRGELYIVIGENDDIVGGASTAQYFSRLAPNTHRTSLCVLPDCDHQFRGTRNGYIVSKAPLWAFQGDHTFPSPKGGIELY